MTLMIKSMAALTFLGALALAGQAAAQGGHQCPAGQYYQKPDGACHAASAKGSCQQQPQMCNELYQPVCGCDGKTYANACHAATKGVSIASQGACPTPSTSSPPAGN